MHKGIMRVVASVAIGIAVGGPGTASADQQFKMEWLTAGKIPLAFKGIDIEKVARRVQAVKKPVKGEYESTEVFEKRASTFESVVIGDGLTMYDVVAYTAVPRNAESSKTQDGSRYTYDADEQMLDVWLPHEPEPLYAPLRSDKLFPVDLKLLSYKHSSYVGANAFGAREKVTKGAYDWVSLGVVDRDVPILKIAMPREQAAKEVPALRTLVLAQLFEPTVITSRSVVPATLDVPIEVEESRRTLPVILKGFVVYSGLTGRVLAKHPTDLGEKSGDKPVEAGSMSK